MAAGAPVSESRGERLRIPINTEDTIINMDLRADGYENSNAIALRVLPGFGVKVSGEFYRFLGIFYSLHCDPWDPFYKRFMNSSLKCMKIPFALILF